jgi:hypothetical protein
MYIRGRARQDSAIMPVYLFTYHAYRSWMPDELGGYVRQGKGHIGPDRKMAAQYRRNAAQDEIEFDEAIRELLVVAAPNICATKGWRLHRIQVVTTHLHALVSWRTPAEWKQVSNSLKRCLGAELSKALDRPGPWFSRGRSRKRVKDVRHLNYLMTTYLPKHGGAFWVEPPQTRQS